MITLSSIILDNNIEQSNLLLKFLSSFKHINVINLESEPVLALPKILFHKPDLVFLEIETPGLDGFDMIHLFHEKKYYPKVVFTSSQSQYGIKALKEGVFDYLITPINENELAECIRRLSLDDNKTFINLSNKENEIISCLMKGNSEKEISCQLNLSPHTISYHKRKILKKYSAKTTTELLIKV